MLAALWLAGCGRGDLETLAADPEYRAAVKESDAGLFEGSSEDEAYATAKKFDVHYLYVAFLELYPESAHRADVESHLSKFRLFKAGGKQILSEEDMREMCWPRSGLMSHWRADNSLAGMAAGGSPAYFGPMLIWSESGSIQMIAGGFTGTPQGYEFAQGAQFVYTTKCRA